MSFRWRALFRRGSWIAFRKFILEEHRDIEKRIAEIDRKVSAIGTVKVFYEKDNDGTVTQKRRGIYVKENTSLHKLCMAYVIQGGNVLDISMFLDPNSSKIDSNTGEVQSTQPLDGRISPLSGQPNQEVFTGGWVGLDKHYWWKVGRAELPSDPKRNVETIIRDLRRGFEKEIKVKRNRIEEKIIKLCDLREQLLQEKKTLRMLQGNTTELDFTTHANIYQIDRVLWQQHEDNDKAVDPEKDLRFEETYLTDNPEGFDQDTQLALRTFYINVYEDADSEKYPYTAL